MAVDERNLILRAAHLLRDAVGVSNGASIECAKRIPVAAGLGGGSADAAATLVGLNPLWQLDLSLDQLEDLAGRLGADVPFALCGGTALATGDGRTLRPLPDGPHHWMVLVPLHSDDPSKTATMYQQLTASDMTDGSMSRRQAAAIAAGSLDYACVHSAFLRAARDRWPEVGGALDILGEIEPSAVSLSGAGPSVFALFQTREVAARGAARVREKGLPARLCRFVGRGEIVTAAGWTQ
jgi:4-diphosphocytidyl-2-C-methyl-D-erythritol kinase